MRSSFCGCFGGCIWGFLCLLLFWDLCKHYGKTLAPLLYCDCCSMAVVNFGASLVQVDELYGDFVSLVFLVGLLKNVVSHVP